MRFWYMRKNAFNKRYTATGAWVITEQTTHKETKTRPSIQQEDKQNTSFGVNFLENYCETTKCRLDDTFTKSDCKNTEKKMATFLKKLNNQRKLSLPISINLTRKKQCTGEVR